MKISVVPHKEGYRLICRHPNLGLSTPAGPRLLRLHPPNIKFFHMDLPTALRDAMKLEEHIKNSPSLKSKAGD